MPSHQITRHYSQLRIAYCSQYRSSSTYLSGTNNTIYEALKTVTPVLDLSGFTQRPSLFYQLLNKLYSYRLLSQTALPYHSWCNVNALAAQLEKVADIGSQDIIYCPSSIAMAALKSINSVAHTGSSILYSDATVKSLIGYYPEWRRVNFRSLTEACDIESFAFDQASMIVMASRWAALSVINDYGISSSKVAVIPRCVNLSHEPRLPSHASLLSKHRAKTLITIARDWKRKGIETLLKAADYLHQVGIPVTVKIIGITRLNRSSPLPDYVEIYPVLDKSNPRDYSVYTELMSSASVYVSPTQAEAMGISLAESLAFSTPVVATDTGGTSTVVTHSVEGYLVSDYRDYVSFAHHIKYLLTDEVAYCSVASAAFRKYQSSHRFCDLGSRLLTVAGI